MKILHVIPSFVPAWHYGGPIKAAFEMGRELVEQGHEVAVFTTNIDGPSDLDVPLSEPVHIQGLEVRYFQVQRPRSYNFSLPLAQGLRKAVTRFDVVHIHSVFNWPIIPAAYFCRRYGVPYIVRPCGMLDPTLFKKAYQPARNPWSTYLKKGLYLYLIEKRNLDGAAAIHFTSAGELEASRWVRCKTPGIIVSLGVDVPIAMDRVEAARRLGQRYPQLDGRKTILFLSRLDPKKGLDLFIPVLGKIAARRDDFVLILAGSGSQAYERKVKDLVHRNGLGSRTIFTGFVEGEEKWSLLHGADIFVLPSHHENFGIAVVEAMACGLPVVVTDHVNIHRSVTEHGAGLVTSREGDEIALALEALLDNPLLRQEMGARGKRLAAQRFSWPGVVRELISLYQNVLDGFYERERWGGSR